MSTKTLFRWEQDGSGGEHGKATYFPDMLKEVTLTIATFKEAHDLHLSIQDAIESTRWDARRGLLNEIGRIEP